ncbi:MAG: ATPase [Gammaproteobacteria bacterium]
MKLTGKQFRSWNRKAITLLGMSGVGKTRLACLLRRHHWFHYSGDYRIGTRYLDEAILDNIKQQAMQVPFLQELLRSDSIHIANNISVDNLKPLSTYLGKLGDPAQGGIGLGEFKRRQALHLAAEIAAMNDVPEFIQKAHQIYGYEHFINDASGSLCELDNDGVIERLAEHTLIIYIKATTENEKTLIGRAEADPKPLYFRESFLDEQLAEYLQLHQLEYAALINPDDFVRWVFPRLFYARLPRYQAIADKYGYSVTTSEIEKVQDEKDFIDLISTVVDR